MDLLCYSGKFPHLLLMRIIGDCFGLMVWVKVRGKVNSVTTNVN